MTTQLDIFVSSKMLELKPEREVLYELLPTLSTGSVTLHAWLFDAKDGAPASNKTIRDVYLNALEKSALYVGLFWNYYGEWTIDEFERATEWGIDRHIYVKDVDANQRDPKLTDFLNKQGAVTAGVTAKWFKTPDELREAVRHSIAVWLEERMVRRPGSTSAVFARDPDDLLERPRKLIGRGDLLAKANALLDTGEPVLLQGFGGMGKTALAAEVAAHRIAAGKGPALWLRAGDETHEALFEAMARPFNMQQEIAKETGDAQLQAVRQLLKAHGVKLLVLDDVWNARALAQVMKAVPPDLSLLVTARQRYPALRLVDVGKLARPASLELLSYHAGTNYAADASADSLCAKLGDSAYALRVAGMTMAVDRLKPADMLQRIENAPHKLKMPPGFADEGQESVAALLEASLNALYMSDTEGSKQAHAVFLAFGALFSPSATPELLSLYMGDTLGADANIENPLTELQRRGLADHMERTDESVAYYRVHDLAYSYTRAQMMDDQRHKALDACLAYTKRYNKPKMENFVALRPELDNFMGAAGWGMAHERYADVETFAWDLNGASDGFMSLQGFYTQATALLKQAASAAEKQVNRHNQGAHLGNLGSAYADLGQYEWAIEHYQQALAISREIGDRRNEGNQLGNLGSSYRNLGQYEQAIEHLQKALAIAGEIGDRRGEGSRLGNLGNAYYSLGQYERAIEYFEQALAISREIGDRHGEGGRLGNLGLAYANLGQYERAIEHHQQALAIARETSDRRNEGNQLGNLGLAYYNLGQYERAIEYHQQALAIARKIGDRRNEGNQLGNLGLAYYNLGQYERAIEYHQQALAIARKIGDRRNEGSQLSNLGSAYYSLGQYEWAIEHYQQARAVFHVIGVRHLVEWADTLIAEAHTAQSKTHRS